MKIQHDHNTLTKYEIKPGLIIGMFHQNTSRTFFQILVQKDETEKRNSRATTLMSEKNV